MPWMEKETPSFGMTKDPLFSYPIYPCAGHQNSLWPPPPLLEEEVGVTHCDP